MNNAKKTMLSRPSRTKIVATVGPASNNEEMLPKLIYAGVDVFRINAAHGTQEEFGATVKRIRTASEKTGLPVGILMDLGGPKIRLGKLPNDELTLEKGGSVAFVAMPFVEKAGDCSEIADMPKVTCTYEPLVNELEVGDRIVLADGSVELRVTATSANPDEWARCEILEGGTVRSRQGVNLPGVKLSIPAMLEIDRSNAAWAAKNGVDFLGLSFVRKASEIRDLKELIAENDGVTQVIAKIEKPEAMENLDEILAESDAVMVARGDLGVETDIAQVAVLQKEIIEKCRASRKPVIVATQMLESMTHNNLPTRAEVSDVTNAIFDGTDACMLSGESAVGDFPVETVEMMHRIALGTEEAKNGVEKLKIIAMPKSMDSENEIQEALASSVCDLAEMLSAKYIVTVTESGNSALSLSANRCDARILALSHSPETLHRMCLMWGVIPMQIVEGRKSAEEIMRETIQTLRHEELVSVGDRLVLYTDSSVETAHNAIVVYEVEK